MGRMDTFYTALAKSLKDHSEKNALTFIREDGSREVFSYGRLDELSSKAANFLVESGLKRSQPAILYMPKSVQFVIYYLAIQKAGSIAVPLNPTFVKSEVSYYLADTNARVIITGQEQFDTINELRQTSRLRVGLQNVDLVPVQHAFYHPGFRRIGDGSIDTIFQY